MELAIKYIFVALLYTECIAGITVNVIIVAANLKKWKTLKSLNTCDTILSFLAISRILYLLSIFIILLLTKICPREILNLVLMTIIKVNMMVLNATNLWIATILCVLYCVKITSYQWKLFIFLKTKISALVPWFLLASLVFSVSSSLPFGWYSFTARNFTHSSVDNLTSSVSLFFVPNIHNQFLIALLGSCPPFVIFCVAVFLLIQSLMIHTKRMKSSEASPNLASHLRAVKSMSLFLLLQLVYFICTTISMSGSLGDYPIWSLLNTAVNCAPPLVHSLYIIYSSSDLQKFFISIFYALKICSQE